MTYKQVEYIANHVRNMSDHRMKLRLEKLEDMNIWTGEERLELQYIYQRIYNTLEAKYNADI